MATYDATTAVLLMAVICSVGVIMAVASSVREAGKRERELQMRAAIGMDEEKLRMHARAASHSLLRNSQYTHRSPFSGSGAATSTIIGSGNPTGAWHAVVPSTPVHDPWEAFCSNV